MAGKVEFEKPAEVGDEGSGGNRSTKQPIRFWRRRASGLEDVVEGREARERYSLVRA
jgi:hypothetical protein